MELVLENYDVKLVLLKKDKIELIRQWRNDPKISQYMEFRDYITPEMQIKWFDSINNDQNYFFIIEFKGKEIGLINIKDIDKDKGEGESGVFIYADEYLSTDVSYRAHLCLFDYFFDILGYKSIKAHIIGDNTRAIRFSLFLGFECVKPTDYILTKGNYYNNRNRQRFVKKYNLLKENKHD